MAKTVIDELVTLITLKTSKESVGNLNSFKKGLGSIGKVALKTSAVLAGLATGLFVMLNKTEKNIAKQARFAKSIGVSFENLQELQGAAKLVGATSDDINQSLSTLTQEMSSPIPGQYNRELLLLGINIKKSNGDLKSATELLLDISKSMQGLTTTQQVQIGKKLGLNEGTIRLLQEGPKAIRDAMIEVKKTGGVIPQKFAQQAIDYDKSLAKLKITLTGFLQILIIQLAPAVEKIIDLIEDLITNHPKLIMNVGKLAAAFTAFIGIMKLVSVGGTALKTFFTLITPLVSGLVDIIALLNPEFIILAAVIAGIIILWPKLVKWAKKLGQVIKQFLTAEVQRLSEEFKKVEKFFGKIKGFFKRGTPNAALSNVSMINRANTKQTIPVPKSGNTNNTTLASNVNNGKTTNNVTIHVNGAQNPNKVAQEVKKQFDLSTALQVASPGFNRPAVA